MGNTVMIRKNHYISQDHLDFFKEDKSLSESQHIRQALNEYIARKRNEKAQKSPSAQAKGGNSHGN